MKKVSILVSTIDSGGAEKQAVLLATQLATHTEVNLIILYGNHAEYKRNVDLLSKSNVKVHKLLGNMFTKMKCIKNIIKHTNSDILFNYLTMPDFIGSVVGRTSGIKVYNGIRNSRLPKSKMIIEKVAHNFLATGTIYNCYSGAKYFENLGFRKK